MTFHRDLFRRRERNLTGVRRAEEFATGGARDVAQARLVGPRIGPLVTTALACEIAASGGARADPHPRAVGARLELAHVDGQRLSAFDGLGLSTDDDLAPFEAGDLDVETALAAR